MLLVFPGVVGVGLRMVVGCRMVLYGWGALGSVGGSFSSVSLWKVCVPWWGWCLVGGGFYLGGGLDPSGLVGAIIVCNGMQRFLGVENRVHQGAWFLGWENRVRWGAWFLGTRWRGFA